MDRHDVYRIIREELSDHHLESKDNGWAVTDRNTGGTYGLHNIVASANQLPAEEREQGVRDWVRRISEFTRADLNPDQARARLRLRLSHQHGVVHQPPTVSRSITEGLLAMVMVHNHLGAETIGPDQLEAWQITRDDALEIALRNTLADEVFEEVVLGKDGLVLRWVRGSFWASTLLLGLPDLFSPDNRYGAIAMVPTRDSLLWFEPRDCRVVETVSEMMNIGGQWYVDGPGPVSPDLYWVRPDSRIERLTRIEGRRYQSAWTPGGDFSRVLWELDRL